MEYPPTTSSSGIKRSTLCGGGATFDWWDLQSTKSIILIVPLASRKGEIFVGDVKSEAFDGWGEVMNFADSYPRVDLCVGGCGPDQLI